MSFFSRVLSWDWVLPVKKVSPLIEVRVLASALRHNLAEFQRVCVGRDIFPVLKANAYGHGIVEVARIVVAAGVKMLCVDSYFEALQLRRADVSTPLLIIGHSSVEQIVCSRLKDVTFTVSDVRVLKELVRGFLGRRDIAIEVDTGMHRHGVLPEELDDVAELIAKRGTNIKVRQIFTHLADADVVDSVHAKQQRQKWDMVASRAKTLFPDVQYLHCDATAGTVEVGAGNAVRLGLGLYGIDAASVGQRVERSVSLRPAMEVVTKIVSLRRVRAGEAVGYNATFVAERNMLVATIPTGYYEGVDRRLSNKGSVYVRGARCIIVGRVSMNMTTVDVSNVDGVMLGDEVVVMSANPTQSNSVSANAELCGTIPYELLVHVPAHLKHVVVG